MDLRERNCWGMKWNELALDQMACFGINGTKTLGSAIRKLINFLEN